MKPDDVSHVPAWDVARRARNAAVLNAPRGGKAFVSSRDARRKAEREVRRAQKKQRGAK
jgi:hypothetical protein